MNCPVANDAPSSPMKARPTAQVPRKRSAVGIPGAVGVRDGAPADLGIPSTAASVMTPSRSPPIASDHRQPSAGTRNELPRRPSAAPALKAELNVPTGTPLRPSGYRLATSPIAGEKNNPAPIPETSRSPSSAGKFGANAPPRLPTARRPVPASDTSREPYRRESRPAGTWKRPAPTRNAASRSPQSATPTEKFAPIAGSPGPTSNQLYAYPIRSAMSRTVA